MRVLSSQEAAAWCIDRGIQVTGNRLSYAPNGRHCITVEHTLLKPYALLNLASTLAIHPPNGPGASSLFWMTAWGIWNEDAENIGRQVLENIKARNGSKSVSRDSPALLFAAGESLDFAVCVVQALLVGWDAFAVPESGEFFSFISHDEVISIVTREASLHQDFMHALENFQPKVTGDFYFGKA